MKHKRKELGFTLHLILGLVLVVVVSCLTGWYVVSHHKAVQDNIAVNSDNFVPGDISVTFKDAVTFQKAKDLIQSLGLTLNQPDAVYQDEFTPHDYRSIRADQFAQISNNLKAYSEVASFVDASTDPSSRAGAGYKWVKFTFRQDVTLARIKTILTSSGLGLGETPEHPVIVFRDIDLKVQVGQENNYISKFQQSLIIQTANRVGKPVLQ